MEARVYKVTTLCNFECHKELSILTKIKKIKNPPLKSSTCHSYIGWDPLDSHMKTTF